MRALGTRLVYASAAILLAAMVVSLLLQIVAREFRLPVDWTEETSRFAFIAMVFLASAYATLRRRHLRVSFLSDLAAGAIGTKPVAIFHLIVLLGFDATMVWFSAINFWDGLRFANISPALGFNQNHLFLIMCIGFFASALINLAELIAVASGRSDGSGMQPANPADLHA